MRAIVMIVVGEHGVSGGLLVDAGLTMGQYLPLLASSLLGSAVAVVGATAEPAR